MRHAAPQNRFVERAAVIDLPHSSQRVRRRAFAALARFLSVVTLMVVIA
jgi:hypothetical protein